MVSYGIVSVYHVNTQYRIESPLPGIAHLYQLQKRGNEKRAEGSGKKLCPEVS